MHTVSAFPITSFSHMLALQDNSQRKQQSEYTIYTVYVNEFFEIKIQQIFALKFLLLFFVFVKLREISFKGMQLIFLLIDTLKKLSLLDTSQF